ncbi:MAG: hypothetical protein CM1200mP41_31660 [Gammaproteobacteria bacterium]|nr:MAG: hypothetical protein CM1200mP41_31660 [Gammaproteobacteria bacterium]
MLRHRRHSAYRYRTLTLSSDISTPIIWVGGAVKLNPDKAKSVFNDSIAGPMNLSLEHAAYGAYQIAASNMMRAIKAVSTERGRDPRNYTLFAFGGNGPVFASAMADALQMKSIVVPPSPGLFSSFGLLYADVEHHYSRTFRQLVRSLDVTQLKNYWDELTQQAVDQLESDGFFHWNKSIFVDLPACTIKGKHMS